MPVRQIAKAELREILVRAERWTNSSERQRKMAVACCCKFEGMSYADIALAMESSTQAVKSLLSRARENLRQMLEPYVQDGSLPQANKEQSGSTPSDSAIKGNGVAGSNGFTAASDT